MYKTQDASRITVDVRWNGSQWANDKVALIFLVLDGKG